MLTLKNGFYADADSYGYTLHQIRKASRPDHIVKAMAARGVEPVKEETDVTIGYYGDLQDVLRGYVKTCLRQRVRDEDLTLAEVRTLLTDLHEEIKAVNE